MKEKAICKKCHYSWIPRKNINEIKECPNCKNREWNNSNKKCLWCGKFINKKPFLKTFCNTRCQNHYHNSKKLKGGKK